MNTPRRQLINLLRGWPSTSLLPTTLVAQASSATFTNTKEAFPALCYGPDSGHEELRIALAQWLTTFYTPNSQFTVGNAASSVSPIDPVRICITGGASQNLACILQVFTDPLYTRGIWCISPMYFLAGRVFEDNGFSGRTFHAVPEDDEGLDISILEQGLQRDEDLLRSLTKDQQHQQHQRLKPLWPTNKHFRRVIYAVPTFSNPSSQTMSVKRRIQLVQLARRFDALVITDDVYDQLQWYSDSKIAAKAPDLASQPRIVDIDRFLDGGASEFGNAVSNGSFSKIIAPGVRTGWAEGTKALAHGLGQCGSSRSGGAPSQAMAAALTRIVESGQLQEHITNTLQPAYSARYVCMMNWIEKLLVPLGVVLPQTNRNIMGGFFIWLELPALLHGDGVARRAKDEEELIIGPGSFFVVPGDTTHNQKLIHSVRVCLAWEDEDSLEEGIRRLARVIRRMLDEGDAGDTGEKLVVSASAITNP